MGGVIFGSASDGSAGDIYGTTYDGGAYGYGDAFKLTPKSDGGWTEKTLHSFNNNGKDGYNPGNLYGTTGRGGTYSEGTAFSVKP